MPENASKLAPRPKSRKIAHHADRFYGFRQATLGVEHANLDNGYCKIKRQGEKVGLVATLENVPADLQAQSITEADQFIASMK